MLRTKQSDKIVKQALQSYCIARNHSIKSDIHMMVGLAIFAIPTLISIFLIFQIIWFVLPISLLMGFGYIWFNKHAREDSKQAKIELEELLKEYSIVTKNA